MSDVNAAAESIVKEQFYVEARIGSHNYRNNAIGKPCRLIYGNGGNVPVDEILKPLADAYLALHPADDGEAIDEAWLEANGFEPALPAKWLFKKGRLLWSSYDGLSLTNDLDGDLPWIKTRGQLRRLLAAIG